MSDKTSGFQQKYYVSKISNPDKPMDCVVLEFDDPNNWEALRVLAKSYAQDGYEKAAAGILSKLSTYEARLAGL